jgi:hypothetical protein
VNTLKPQLPTDPGVTYFLFAPEHGILKIGFSAQPNLKRPKFLIDKYWFEYGLDFHFVGSFACIRRDERALHDSLPDHVRAAVIPDEYESYREWYDYDALKRFLEV